MHFLKLRKIHVSYKISTFLLFISLVNHIVHIRTETCMKIALKQRFLPPKNAFLDIFFPKLSQSIKGISQYR